MNHEIAGISPGKGAGWPHVRFFLCVWGAKLEVPPQVSCNKPNIILKIFFYKKTDNIASKSAKSCCNCTYF